VKLILQKRDIEILKFVYTFRVASVAQLVKRFFGGAFRTVGIRRIKRLARAGFLNLDGHFNGKKAGLHARLTNEGWKHISHSFGFEIDKPHLHSESPAHDLRVCEMAVQLEKLSTFERLITENILESASAITASERYSAVAAVHPDGILVLKPKNAKPYIYSLEVELSRKIPERYQNKLLDYYTVNQLDGVLYIVDSLVTQKMVVDADREIRGNRPSILYFSSVENVISSEKKIRFQRADGGAIELY
jgi:hypothetical protein